MLEETREAPGRDRAPEREPARAIGDFATQLRKAAPTAMLTLARGSSDHAAAFAAYLIMSRTGRLVTSLPLSIVTLLPVEDRLRRARGARLLAVGRKPRSRPVHALPRRARCHHGRLRERDRLAPRPRRQWVLPLAAGEERGVAATKSFIAQLAAAARLVAAWQGARDLEEAVDGLPAALDEALRCDWSAGVETLADAERMFVIGRGTGLAIALEAALKLKETCALQAEAFSGAELMHGPLALVEPGFPLIVFAPRGPAQAGLLALAADLRAHGARVLLAAPAELRTAIFPSRPRPATISIPCARSRASTPWSRRSPARAGSIPTGRAICKKSRARTEE
jgi:glucosamine--fructose-6-phosphate aminotransferase (isomerizing)